MAVVGEPEISLEGALEAIQRHSFNEALEFAPRTDGHSEESTAPIAFTRVLAILNKQPKTQGNTERAAQLCPTPIFTSSYPLAGASMRILTRCVADTLPQPFATSTQRSTGLSKKPGIKTPISPPNGSCKRSA